MKGKHLAILLGLLVVIGGASWLLQKNNDSAWSNSSAQLGGKILNLPLNEVARIVVKADDGQVNLVKKDAGWTVAERADYPASYEKISELLRKSWDLKTVQPVTVGPSQLGRLGLVEPGKEGNSAILVDFQDKDGKRLEAILLGKAFTKKADGELAALGDLPVGRYVRPAKDGSKASLVSERFESVAPEAPLWLDKDFFKITDPLTISLAGATEAQQWKVTRESTTADWQLADLKPGEIADKDKPAPLASVFVSPSFADVLPADAKPADTGLDKPSVITIEDANRFVYTLKVGKLIGDNYPLTFSVSTTFLKERAPGKDEKPEDKAKLDEAFKTETRRLEEKLAAEKKFEGHIYLLTKATLEPILKDRSTLLGEKKPETPPATPDGAAAPAPGAAPALPPTATPPVPVPPPTPAAPADAPPTAATPPVQAPPPAPPAPAAPQP